jgi:hypothetical protein
MVGHGHRLSYAKLEARYGTPKARAILREGVIAFDSLLDHLRVFLLAASD